MHLVLRLKDRVPAFFNPRDKNLRRTILKVADKHGVKIYELICNHTHCHTVIKISKRSQYVAFIRELTSKLVSYFSLGCGLKLKKLFQSRPWSRVVQWGRDFDRVKKYMLKNQWVKTLLRDVDQGRNTGG